MGKLEELIVGIPIVITLGAIAMNAFSAYTRRERDIQNGTRRSLSEYLVEFKENLKYFLDN